MVQLDSHPRLPASKMRAPGSQIFVWDFKDTKFVGLRVFGAPVSLH